MSFSENLTLLNGLDLDARLRAEGDVWINTVSTDGADHRANPDHRQQQLQGRPTRPQCWASTAAPATWHPTQGVNTNLELVCKWSIRKSSQTAGVEAEEKMRENAAIKDRLGSGSSRPGLSCRPPPQRC